MSKQVVAKMRCYGVPDEARIQEIEKQEGTAVVTLGAVYEPDDGKRSLPENAVFGKATPWGGECKMGIANPAALRFFKPGKSYYITFTDAPD